MEALALSHRIAVMNQGRIEQVDEPSRLYGFPRNRFVADFIGHITMMDAQVEGVGHSHLHLSVAGLGEIVAPLPQGVAAGDKGLFAIRPEQVRIGVQAELAELKNHFIGEVQSLLYQGDVSVYRVRLPNGTLIEALLPNSAPGGAELFKVGAEIKVGWRHDAGVFLR